MFDRLIYASVIEPRTCWVREASIYFIMFIICLLLFNYLLHIFIVYYVYYITEPVPPVATRRSAREHAAS